MRIISTVIVLCFVWIFWIQPLSQQKPLAQSQVQKKEKQDSLFQDYQKLPKMLQTKVQSEANHFINPFVGRAIVAKHKSVLNEKQEENSLNLESYVLRGTVAGRTATIVDPMGKSHLLRLGDSLQNMVLVKIQKNTVEFKKGSQRGLLERR